MPAEMMEPLTSRGYLLLYLLNPLLHLLRLLHLLPHLLHLLLYARTLCCTMFSPQTLKVQGPYSETGLPVLLFEFERGTSRRQAREDLNGAE